MNYLDINLAEMNNEKIPVKFDISRIVFFIKMDLIKNLTLIIKNLTYIGFSDRIFYRMKKNFNQEDFIYTL
jgi:hypothetical protein